MEYLTNGYTLEIPEGCFPISTDSMALACYAGSCRGHVLDLGSGCGTLGVLLCAQDPKLHVTGIELDPRAHAAALHNIARNGLSERMSSICEDLRNCTYTGLFDCAVSNPPYFHGGPAAKLTAARREDTCTLAELIAVASRALKFGGDFYIVHRAERLGEVIAEASRCSLEAKELTLLRHDRTRPVGLFLLKLRKGAKPGLQLHDWDLYHEDGTPTEIYHRIYHIGV